MAVRESKGIVFVPKNMVCENLWSDHERSISIQRSIEVESVFGHFKENRSFRRFLLRSLPNVSIEVGLLSLAHNLLKKAAIHLKKMPKDEISLMA
jgi:Transposase DDE domain